MPTIHILQQDLDAGVMDSYLIDTAAIAELHCRYPLQLEDETDEDVDPQTPEEEQSESESDDTEHTSVEFGGIEPELNVLYTNGERLSLIVAVPTSFLLYLEGGEMVCKTTKLQEFEKASLDAFVQAYEADDSSE